MMSEQTKICDENRQCAERVWSLRSTLTSQLETLLGTMFQDQNGCIKNSVNGNEYFFNQVLYYIMEFFELESFFSLLWNEYQGSQITSWHLKGELD